MDGIDQPMIPAITIKAENQYVLGFPILIAVALHNDTVDSDYLDLPELGLLPPLDSVGVDLRLAGAGADIRLGPSFHYREQSLFRMRLMAGQSTRTVIDLSQFGSVLKPGRYTLQLSLFETGRVFRSSNTVDVDLLEPTPVELAEGTRLRRMALRANAVDTGSWQPFLTGNWNTVLVSSSLGPIARQQLALHDALHRAAYGPQSLAQLPIDTFAFLQGDVLSAEAALLDYEISVAHGDKVKIDRARTALLRLWPDLRLRVLAVDRHEGLLGTLRTAYGAERVRPLPGPRPYAKPEQN